MNCVIRRALYRRRRLIPAGVPETFEQLRESASRAGSTLEADGGQSSALILTFGLVERAISHFDHFKYGAFARRYRLEKDESVANSSFETTTIADNSVLADAAGMRDSRRDRSDR